MTERITVSQVDRVPADARIHHYDELPERAKNHLPRLVKADASNVTASERLAAVFEEYDHVKFTDYYRITVGEESPTSPDFR
ncbi:hypothetical protein [Haloterrigena alkaliphila]|uniref:hypothetical protein n=1 Tax=Haloterrigena alkaliphila TaxID=2816475 RepID=UPI001CFFF2C3|nr:hypothetical protein [Haloterrigena alkaliphila]UHQ95190.1 hypothetical protein J0X25_18995 [Haloterrigena alkaliphila]